MRGRGKVGCVCGAERYLGKEHQNLPCSSPRVTFPAWVGWKGRFDATGKFAPARVRPGRGDHLPAPSLGGLLIRCCAGIRQGSSHRPLWWWCSETGLPNVLLNEKVEIARGPVRFCFWLFTPMFCSNITHDEHNTCRSVGGSYPVLTGQKNSSLGLPVIIALDKVIDSVWFQYASDDCFYLVWVGYDVSDCGRLWQHTK